MSYRNQQCQALTRKGAQCSSGAMNNSEFCGPHQGYDGPRPTERMVEVPISVMRDLYKLARKHGEEDLAYVINDLAKHS